MAALSAGVGQGGHSGARAKYPRTTRVLVQFCPLPGPPFPLPNFLGEQTFSNRADQAPDSLSSGYNHHPMTCHSGPPRQPAFLWAERSLPSKRVDLCPKP